MSVELTRRDFMRISGATAIGWGALAGRTAAASSSPTAIGVGTTSLERGAATTSMTASVITSIADGLTTDPLADRSILHALASNEAEWLSIFEILIENHLTDTRTIASIEARHGIAMTWEDGGTTGDGYNNALTRIRRYYSNAIEHNVIEVTNKAALQLSHVRERGGDTDPEFAVVGSGEDSVDEWVQLHISPDRTTSSVTRHDGETHELGSGLEGNDEVETDEVTPLLEVWDDDHHEEDAEIIGTVELFSDQVLDGYDPHEREFTFVVENDDGDTEEITSNLLFTIPNVSDLGSRNVFDFRDFADLLADIEDQSDTVVGNYDQSFVEEIFDLLDDGTISPSDVRSSEGLARFLSGEDDASKSSHRLALMQQLGMQQPDLSQVASMEIEFSGATQREVSPHPDDESDSPQEFRRLVTIVDDEDYEGILFARDVGGGLAAGDTVAVNDHDYYLWSSNDQVAAVRPDDAIDQDDGETVWTLSGSNDLLVDYSAHAHHLAVLEENSELWIVDPDSGHKTATIDSAESPNDVAAGESLAVISDNEGDVRLVDLEDGSLLWTESLTDGDRLDHVAISEDDEWIAAAGSGKLFVLDRDGDVVHDIDDTDTMVSLHIDASYGQVYLNGVNTNSDAPIRAYALDSGEQVWTWDDYVDNSASNLAIAPDGTIYQFVDDAIFVSIDPDDGETIDESSSTFGDRVSDLAYDPYREILIGGTNGEDLKGYDPDDSYNIIWEVEPFDGGFADDVAVPFARGVDGYIANASFFDGPSGEEIGLHRGHVEIHSITDADGNEVEIEGDDWSEPEYDQFDSGDWATYLDGLEDYQDSVQSHSDVSIGVPSFGDWLENQALLGVGIVTAILVAMGLFAAGD